MVYMTDSTNKITPKKSLISPDLETHVEYFDKVVCLLEKYVHVKKDVAP